MNKNRASELWGGLAAMLVALPQAIAFGVVVYSVLGPSYAAEGALAGIIGTAAIGIVAALLGGAPRLISAPSAPAAAVMASLAAGLAPLAADGRIAPERITLLLALTALLSGALQFLYGALGGGRLIKYIPYPVVTGYLSGVGILIFLSQLPKLFGLPKGIALWAGLTAPGLWSATALIVGAVTLTVMTAAPRWIKAVPAPILAVAAGVLAYLGLGLLRPELRVLAGNPLVIGPIAGAQKLSWAGLLQRWDALRGLGPSDLSLILNPALTLSVLLSIDTLKTCVVVDALTRSRHDSNRELRAQGAANLASALAGGLPGSGMMGATLVNVASGGRTRLSGALAGACALAVFLLAGPLVAWVPLSALAGILLVVAFRMFDRKSFRLLRQRSTMLDFAVSGAVIVAAIFTDLVVAAGVGLALAILLFMRDLMNGSVIRRKTYGDRMFSKQKRLPAEAAVLERRGGETVVCELQGSLFFGTTDQLFTELEPDLKTRKYVILDLRHIQSLDFTAAHMLKQIEDYLHDRQGRLILCDLPRSLPTGQDLQTYFNEVGLVKPTRNVSLFSELDDALEWVEENVLEEERFAKESGKAPLELPELDLFREWGPELLSALGECLGEKSFAAGSGIFKLGEQGDELFVIRRGRVRISLPLAGGQAHHISTFRRGDFFGEVAFLDRGTRTADATATYAADLYVLSRTRFNEVSRRHPELGAQLFARLARTLANRLRLTDNELRALQEA